MQVSKGGKKKGDGEGHTIRGDTKQGGWLERVRVMSVPISLDDYILCQRRR